MTNPQGIEKRKDPRFDVQIKVDYESKDIFESNYMMNISRGGVFIRTDNPLPMHSSLTLRFTFPDSSVAIETAGEVVWTYDMKKGSVTVSPGMGIRFTAFPEELRTYLEGYLKKLSDQKKKEPRE